MEEGMEHDLRGGEGAGGGARAIPPSFSAYDGVTTTKKKKSHQKIILFLFFLVV